MSSSYSVVISKLDEFIRKYYKNQLVRGSIYALALCLSCYIALVIAEYYGDFSIPLRTVLFYSFAGGILYILGRFIAFPLFKLYKIGEVLSYEEAAGIIGKHFSEVQDKLLNVLQLNSQFTTHNSQLLEAGIEQKIRELKPISFPQAIDISGNRKYIPYAAIPAAALILAWLVVPALLRQGTKRMIHYNTSFPKVAPFEFVIENNNLQAIQQKDFTLKLKLKGDQVPEEVYIQYEGSTFKMSKESPVSFLYTFTNVQHDETFLFNAAGYESQEYKLTTLPEPQMAGFDVKLHYPAYINRKDEILHNTGDLSIPQGTVVSWNFNTNNTDKLLLKFGDSTNQLIANSQQRTANNQLSSFSFSHRFMQSSNYSVSASNKYFTNHDSVKYVVQVIPDLYPSIQAEQKQDSLSAKSLYFNGAIKDDYGFNKLTFIYRIYNADDSSSNSGKIYRTEVSIGRSVTQQPFYFYWNTDTLSLSPGQQMEYYFEVWDNDGVNGSKSTRSAAMYYKVPSLQEIQKNTEDNNSKIQNDISKTVQEAYMLQSKMEQERADLFNKSDMNWADKKKIDDLLNQQMEMQKKAEEIAKKNKENNKKQWDYQKKDSDLMAKQDQLQKLFNQLASDSLKKKMEELQKMMDKMNKDQVQQQLDKLAMDNQDFKKELERTLELFKQLDFQQQLKQTQQRLDSLAQRQEQLSKDSKNADNKSGKENKENKENAGANKDNKENNGNKENKETAGTRDSKDGKENKESNGSPENKDGEKKDIAQQQEQLNKDFDDLKKNMENLQKKNSELEEPTGYKNPEQESQEVQKNMQNASEQLSQNKRNKASQSQHSASQAMQKMSGEMASMEMDMEAQQDEANQTALRNILNNIVELSFEQENLMDKVTANNQGNTQYATVAYSQKQLQDKAATIADSLYTLSKHAPQVQGIVNQEMSKINYNMEQAVASLETRQPSQAASRQQYSMTSINNLALMLSDVLQSMQQQAQSQKHSPGTGSCNKPGGMGSKPSMSQLQKMQEAMSKQLDAMKKAMENGKKPGQKQGNQSGGQNDGNSEELAKMAAQQQYIREQMQAMEDQMNDKKQGGGELGNIEQDMSKNEEDILNKQITDATLNRQQQIIHHLLEYEKAKQTKEQSPEFESHVAKKQFFGNPNPFLQYNSEKSRQDELLKTVPPDLNSFYRDKVNQYFNSFQE